MASRWENGSQPAVKRATGGRTSYAQAKFRGRFSRVAVSVGCRNDSYTHFLQALLHPLGRLPIPEVKACAIAPRRWSGEADFFIVPIEPEGSLFYDWTNPNFPASPVMGGRKA